jgi:hypothetical protein
VAKHGKGDLMTGVYVYIGLIGLCAALIAVTYALDMRDAKHVMNRRKARRAS